MCYNYRDMIQHYVYIYIYYSVQDQYSSTAQRDGAWCMDGRANPLMHDVLYVLTSKCASRHNGVRLFNISTSKSAPDVSCF